MNSSTNNNIQYLITELDTSRGKDRIELLKRLADVAEKDPGRFSGRLESIIAASPDIPHTGLVDRYLSEILLYALESGEIQSEETIYPILKNLTKSPNKTAAENAIDALSLLDPDLEDSDAIFEFLTALAWSRDLSERDDGNPSKNLYDLINGDIVWFNDILDDDIKYYIEFFEKKHIQVLTEDLNSDDIETRRAAARILKEISAENPQIVTPAGSALVDAISDKDQFVRSKAGNAFVNFAVEQSEAVDYIESLTEHLRSEDIDIRKAAMNVLKQISAENPQVAKPAGSTLASHFGSEEIEIRREAVKVLQEISEENPQIVKPTVSALAEATNDNDDTLRLGAGEILTNFARDQPEQVAPFAETLVELVEWEENTQNTVRAILAVAEENPEPLSPYTDRISPLLDTDQSNVRKMACEILSEIGDESVLDDLRDLRDDEEPDVRIAAETAIQQVQQTGSMTPTEATQMVDSGSGSFDNDGSDMGITDVGTIPASRNLTSNGEAFERLEPLGSGGNADVYRARIEEGDVEVALKQPRFQGRTLGKQVIDQFSEEATTWAKIDDHKNIVEIIDVGTQPYPWIAMEYMDRGNLTSLIGDVELMDGVRIGVGIVNAVRHAHRRGIAHLDLKPENVLLTKQNGKTIPKVADWGLSQMLIEHSRSVEGYTPQYAAPEQFDSNTHGSPNDLTDIYQIGAVLYELFTGEPAFSGPPAQVMHGVLHETPDPPTDIDPSLPPKIDQILLRALETEKEDRYETLVNLRRDLRELFEKQS
jgi:HEAT repeat protein